MPFEGLKVINPALLQRFNDYIKNLSKTDNVAIVMDNDSDGMSAAAVLQSALLKLRKIPVQRVTNFDKDPAVFSKKMQLLKKEGITIVFFVDLPMDSYHPDKIEHWSWDYDIVVIDHHKVTKEFDSDKILFFKPQMVFETDASSYNSSKLVYDLFSQFVNLEDVAWLACIGIVGDSVYSRWKAFVDPQFKKMNLKENSDIFESDFGLLSNVIYCTHAVHPESMLNLFDFLVNHSPQEILKSEFRHNLELVFGELEEKTREFEQNKEEFPEQELIFFNFSCRYDIKSILINKLSHQRYPARSLIFVTDTGKQVLEISARRQDKKVKLNDLLSSVTVPLGGHGGGHIPAAGGSIPRNKLKKFKEAIVDALASGKFANAG